MSHSTQELSIQPSIITHFNVNLSAEKEMRELLDKAQNNQRFNNNSIEQQSVVGAVVFLVKWDNDEPVLSREIADFLDVSHDNLIKNARRLSTEFDITYPIRTPEDFLPIFIERLDCDEEVYELANEILDVCKEEQLHFSSPAAFAAGAIYAASKELNLGITQREISEVSRVSEVSIRNWYQDQLEIYKNHD